MDYPAAPCHVLFFCVTNSTRSQMAEGLARQRHGASIQAWSAGARIGNLDPIAVEVMREINIDIAAHYSKTLADLPGRRFDLIVTLTPVAHMALPSLPYRPRILPLDIPNPRRLVGDRYNRQSLYASYRQIRDLLAQLIGTLDLSSATTGRRPHAERRRRDTTQRRPSGEYSTPAAP